MPLIHHAVHLRSISIHPISYDVKGDFCVILGSAVHDPVADLGVGAVIKGEGHHRPVRVQLSDSLGRKGCLLGCQSCLLGCQSFRLGLLPCCHCRGIRLLLCLGLCCLLGRQGLCLSLLPCRHCRGIRLLFCRSLRTCRARSCHIHHRRARCLHLLHAFCLRHLLPLCFHCNDLICRSRSCRHRHAQCEQNTCCQTSYSLFFHSMYLPKPGSALSYRRTARGQYPPHGSIA